MASVKVLPSSGWFTCSLTLGPIPWSSAAVAASACLQGCNGLDIETFMLTTQNQLHIAMRRHGYRFVRCKTRNSNQTSTYAIGQNDIRLTSPHPHLSILSASRALARDTLIQVNVTLEQCHRHSTNAGFHRERLRAYERSYAACSVCTPEDAWLLAILTNIDVSA